LRDELSGRGRLHGLENDDLTACPKEANTSMIDRKALKELLNKNWMTHDAMWFVHCMNEIGIENTNRINRAAVKSMALIEVKRLMEAFEMETVSSFSEFRRFVDAAFDVVKADFMAFEVGFRPGSIFSMNVENCFVYRGIRRIGAIERYECGLFDRIEGWLEGMGVAYEIIPVVKGCMMHTHGVCRREFRLALPE